MKFIKKHIIILVIVIVLMAIVLKANYNDQHTEREPVKSDPSEITTGLGNVHIFQEA